MSAESKFVSLLRAANFSESTTREVVDEILSEHAHELAEKVRNEFFASEGEVIAAQAADLIDPEVE